MMHGNAYRRTYEALVLLSFKEKRHYGFVMAEIFNTFLLVICFVIKKLKPSLFRNNSVKMHHLLTFSKCQERMDGSIVRPHKKQTIYYTPQANFRNDLTLALWYLLETESDPNKAWDT